MMPPMYLTNRAVPVPLLACLLALAVPLSPASASELDELKRSAPAPPDLAA